jgi:hypothetical protein
MAKDLPPAVREDRDPFAFFIHAGGLGSLAFLRWTNYSCPHCRVVFRRDYWSRNVKLGSGLRICDHCGTGFDDGSREWPQLTHIKKLRLFFPPLIIGIWGGFAVAGIASLFIGPRDEHSLGIVIFAFITGLLPAVFLSPIQFWRINRSIRRYNAHDRALFP